MRPGGLSQEAKRNLVHPDAAAYLAETRYRSLVAYTWQQDWCALQASGRDPSSLFSRCVYVSTVFLFHCSSTTVTQKARMYILGGCGGAPMVYTITWQIWLGLS